MRISVTNARVNLCNFPLPVLGSIPGGGQEGFQRLLQPSQVGVEDVNLHGELILARLGAQGAGKQALSGVGDHFLPHGVGDMRLQGTENV